MSQTSGPTTKPPEATKERLTTPVAVVNKLTPPPTSGVSTETSRGHDHGMCVVLVYTLLGKFEHECTNSV